MPIFLEIILGIASVVAILAVFGFILGCFRFWNRQPYDDDMSFKDFVWSGIVDSFKWFLARAAKYVVVLILVFILIKVFS